MIYDIITGTRLGENHYSQTSFKREDLASDDLTTLYKELFTSASEALNTTSDLPNREEMLSVLAIIQGNLYVKGEPNFLTVAEGFDALSYYGLECYILRRDDLSIVDDEPRAVRAYIIRTSLNSENPRCSGAIGISSTEITMGSTSDIVMEALRSKVRLTPSLESILNIDNLISDWELMSDAGAGYEFDVTDLQTLLEDRGYRIKIYLNRI